MKLKLTLTIILTLSIILSVAGYYLNNLAFETSRIQPTLEEKFLGKITEIGNYTDKDYYNQREPEIFISKYDLIHPVYTILLSDCIYNYIKAPSKPKNECSSFTGLVFVLERTGILTWKVLDFNATTISNSNLEKARLTVSFNNLLNSQGEIDSQIIGVNPKFNNDQMEQIKKDQAGRDKTAEYNKLPKPERQKICEENLAKIKSNYENALKEAANGSTKYSETDFLISKKVIDTTDCSRA